MKKRLITAIICLGLMFVMSFGVVSAGGLPGGTKINFVSPSILTSRSYTDSETAAGVIDIKVNVSLTDSSGTPLSASQITNDLKNITIEILKEDETVHRTFTNSSNTLSYLYHDFGTLAVQTYTIKAYFKDTTGWGLETDPVVTLTTNPPPVVSFGIKDASGSTTDLGFVSDTFSFDAGTTTDSDTPLTYKWDFNNDKTVDDSTSGVQATYKYTAAGIYTVNLTVTDSKGASAYATKKLYVRPDCVSVGADETCVAVPENMGPTNNQGLECDIQAADRYCKCEGYAAGYAGQSITDKMTCDGGGHTGGSRALSCALSDGGSAITTWILSVVCSGTASAAGACTETDEGDDPFGYGELSIDGTFVDNDTCLAGTLNETYCSNNQLVYKEYDCSALTGLGCTEGACIEPPGGLLCQPDSDKGLSNPVGQGDRDRGDGDVIFYCGLNLTWSEAKELEEDCTASYECISNSCVEEECYGVRTAIAEQANLLQKIWCFLTNMGNYFSDTPTDYCACFVGFEASDEKCEE